MRVTERQKPNETIIVGRDWRRVWPLTLIPILLAIPATPWTFLVAALAVPASFGVGFRLTVDRNEVRLLKSWLGIPYLRRRYSLEAEVRVYDDEDNATWEGVVLADPGMAERAREVFGSSDNGAELARVIAEAMERHRQSPRRLYR